MDPSSLFPRSDHPHLHGNGGLYDPHHLHPQLLHGKALNEFKESCSGPDISPFPEDEVAVVVDEDEFGHGSARFSSQLSRCSSSDSIVTDATSSSDRSLDAYSLQCGHWTDDKHESYLTFMEENFVKEMFENRCSNKPHIAVELTPRSPLMVESESESNTRRSVPKEHWNTPPPNMPRPCVNTLRQTPITHVRPSSQSRNANNRYPSPFSSEGAKEQECILKCSNDEAQNRSVASSKIDNARNREVEDTGRKVKAYVSKCQVTPHNMHHSSSFTKPRKRRQMSNLDNEQKISTRRKLVDQ